MKLAQLLKRMQQGIASLSLRKQEMSQSKWQNASYAKLPPNWYDPIEFDYCYPILKQLWASRDPVECYKLKAKLKQRREWYNSPVPQNM